MTNDTIAALKIEQAYKDEVKAMADKIKAEATSLEQAKALYPDVIEIKTSREFNVGEYLFQEQLYLSTAEIYQTVGRKDIGAIGGPLQDFRGESYFVELLKRTGPSEEEMAAETWKTKEKQLREQALQMAGNEFMADYRLHLRNSSGLETRINQALISDLLRLDEPEEGETEAAPVTETEDADEAGSAAQ